MSNPSPYRYLRRGRRAALVIQTRNPATGTEIPAGDLEPFRALVEISAPCGRLPARTICLLHPDTAARMGDKIEPLEDIEGDSATAFRIPPKRSGAFGPRFIP